MHSLKKYWLSFLEDERESDTWWARKKALFKKRQADIVRINGKGHVFHKMQQGNRSDYHYFMHLSFLIKQGDYFYVEEQVVPYECELHQGEMIAHRPLEQREEATEEAFLPELNGKDRNRFTYDRLAAVQYAERWWNSYNPEFRVFDVDCTNYVSQCLYAGGAPMREAPDRSKGWWYQGDNWSYSWAVSHSLRWYLSGSTTGLQGKEVESPEELSPGDVICYDFEDDGRYDHSTFVVAKDANDMPLVNAHTQNSRHRYWSYEDSSAWTPSITYKFFQIGKK